MQQNPLILSKLSPYNKLVLGIKKRPQSVNGESRLNQSNEDPLQDAARARLARWELKKQEAIQPKLD